MCAYFKLLVCTCQPADMVSFEGGTLLLREMVTMLRSRDMIHRRPTSFWYMILVPLSVIIPVLKKKTTFWLTLVCVCMCVCVYIYVYIYKLSRQQTWPNNYTYPPTWRKLSKTQYEVQYSRKNKVKKKHSYTI